MFSFFDRALVQVCIKISVLLLLTGICSPVGASPALPVEQCQTKSHTSWSEAEAWVWENICTGSSASFNLRYSEHLDPASQGGWDNEERDRRLSQNFIEMILLHQPWAGAIPRQGVIIMGALFPEGINLENAKIKSELTIGRSRFPSWLVLMEASFDGSVYFDGSVFESSMYIESMDVSNSLSLRGIKARGKLDMNDVKVGRTLVMSDSTFDNEVIMYRLHVDKSFFLRKATINQSLNLNRASIGGTVTLDQSVFRGDVNMAGMRIGDSVYVRDAVFHQSVDMRNTSVISILEVDNCSFHESLIMQDFDTNGVFLTNSSFNKEINLNNAAIDAGLTLNGSTFESNVIMFRMQVGRAFFMENAMVNGELDLLDAKLGGVVYLTNSKFGSAVSFEGIQVSGFFSARGASFASSVTFIGAQLNDDIDLTNTVLTDLDLTGTRIAGQLGMGSKRHGATKWNKGGQIVLRNTRVNTIQDKLESDKDSWPNKIQFDGFIYDRLGGIGGAGPDVDMLARETSWFVDWLARDPSFSPQPYEQLARIFRQAGYPAKANDILYAGRERERMNATRLTRIGLETLKWSIGYGLGKRYFRALWWVSSLVMLGMLVLKVSGEGRRNHMPYGLSFSLDHLLPVVTLRKYHFDVVLKGWPRYYFYFHKLMGYVLASFLIAGMAGLTQ